MERVKQLIISENIDPKMPDSRQDTLLHFACQLGKLELAQWLVSEHKVNCDLPDKDGKTPLHWAYVNGHMNVVKWLITECGVKVPETSEFKVD